MKLCKIAAAVFLGLSLSACVDGGSNSVARLDTLSTACPTSPMMQTAGLPVRCGPQSALPYTVQ